MSAIKAPALMILDEYGTLDTMPRRPALCGGPLSSIADPRTLMVSHKKSCADGICRAPMMPGTGALNPEVGLGLKPARSLGLPPERGWDGHRQG